MAVLGDCVLERRRGSLPAAFRAVDGEHWPHAWLLWRIHLIPHLAHSIGYGAEFCNIDRYSLLRRRRELGQHQHCRRNYYWWVYLQDLDVREGLGESNLTL
jgi:hypothetical protein